jgi:hypothetical protein
MVLQEIIPRNLSDMTSEILLLVDVGYDYTYSFAQWNDVLSVRQIIPLSSRHRTNGKTDSM